MIFWAVEAVCAHADSPRVSFVWRDSGKDQVLNDGPLSGQSKALWRITQEKDPVSGQVVTWQGFLLSGLIDQALSQLTLEQRASVDLVILKGKDGTTVRVPRAFITQYPVVLALKRSGEELGDRGPVISVVPWTSSKKAALEALPLEKFFVPGVETIVLTNGKILFGEYLLRKRSDPRAVRGEKLYVQTCMGCHAPGTLKRASSLENIQTPEFHRSVKGMPQFGDPERRALVTYFRAAESDGLP